MIKPKEKSIAQEETSLVVEEVNITEDTSNNSKDPASLKQAPRKGLGINLKDSNNEPEALASMQRESRGNALNKSTIKSSDNTANINQSKKKQQTS